MNLVRKWILVVGLFATLPAIGLAETALETAKVTQQVIPNLQLLDGHIEAVNQSTVSAQTSGVIESLTYDVDDFVEKGSLIAKIRSINQQAGVQQAGQSGLKAVAKWRKLS